MKKKVASVDQSLEVKMFGYKVSISRRCIESEHSSERYGSWSEDYVQEIGRIIEKTNDYPDAVSIFDFPAGTNVLVVWATYSTGDSFGRASGGGSEVFGVFQDLKSATELRTALEEFNTKDYLNCKLNIKTSDGQVFTQYVPWTGYFESLDSVDIDVVTVF